MSILMHSFNNVEIPQSQHDATITGTVIPKGYVNATLMCKASGKRLDNFFRQEKAEAFIQETSTVTSLSRERLIIVIQGGNDKDLQGTWVHPNVAMNLAQWISPKFAAWAAEVLARVMRNDFQALTAEAAEAQAKLQEQWVILREAGKVTRLKLTDAIKSWYERNPGGTSRPEHAMYAQTTDNIYKALWGKNAKQLEVYLGCDRHEVRNVIDSESLAILERAEDRVIEFIDEDNIKPVDAVNAAGIRAKKELPKSKLW